jgi:hypothetical protein
MMPILNVLKKKNKIKKCYLIKLIVKYYFNNISEHIKRIFEEGEPVVRKFRTTSKHGAVELKGKPGENWTNFYNLDVIISVATG